VYAPSMAPAPSPRSVLLSMHRFSWRCLEVFEEILRGLWAGLWLGVLGRDRLHALDSAYYGTSATYPDRDHNLGGLFSWEAEALDRFFGECRRIVLLGAGGGREVLPLIERGFEVDAFECHEGLREVGNRLLEERGAETRIMPMERDRCPALEGPYDGVIVGWGMMTLVQGRETRVRLLRDLRSVVSPEAPLLLSFFIMPNGHRAYRLAWRVAAILRWVMGRERPDFGDYLSPRYAHFFTQESMEAEMREAGWRPAFFDCRTYPHAVALADTVEEAATESSLGS